MATRGKVPPGLIFRRYRKLRDGKVLDARDYGYQAWPIRPKPPKRPKPKKH